MIKYVFVQTHYLINQLKRYHVFFRRIYMIIIT